MTLQAASRVRVRVYVITETYRRLHLSAAEIWILSGGVEFSIAAALRTVQWVYINVHALISLLSPEGLAR